MTALSKKIATFSKSSSVRPLVIAKTKNNKIEIEVNVKMIGNGKG